jgi:hypothetical protein
MQTRPKGPEYQQEIQRRGDYTSNGRGLDIDGTIIITEEFFRMLTAAVYREGGKVIVVSARSNTTLARRENESEMRGIRWRMDNLRELTESMTRNAGLTIREPSFSLTTNVSQSF